MKIKILRALIHVFFCFNRLYARQCIKLLEKLCVCNLHLFASWSSDCLAEFIAAAFRVMLCFRAFRFWLPTRWDFSDSSELSCIAFILRVWLLVGPPEGGLFWCLLLAEELTFCKIFFFFVRCCFFFSWNSSKLNEGRASIFFSKLKSLQKLLLLNAHASLQ